MDRRSNEEIENDVFTDDVSDEALEIAAASSGVLGTSAACTPTHVWSTFCPG